MSEDYEDLNHLESVFKIIKMSSDDLRSGFLVVHCCAPYLPYKMAESRSHGSSVTQENEVGSWPAHVAHTLVDCS